MGVFKQECGKVENLLSKILINNGALPNTL